MKIIYIAILFNLSIVLTGCATYHNKNENVKESFDVRNIKRISKKYFKSQNYVLEFSDAFLHNFYYFFDNNKIKSFHLFYDNTQQKFLLIENKEKISDDLKKIINRIRKNSSLSLESTEKCLDCHVAVLYEVIKKNGNTIIHSEKIISQNYTGVLN